MQMSKNNTIAYFWYFCVDSVLCHCQETEINKLKQRLMLNCVYYKGEGKAKLDLDDDENVCNFL
jgi:hypothetical protein